MGPSVSHGISRIDTLGRSGHPGHAMNRRLAALLLAAAIVLAGVVAGPCAGGACALAQARQMDCCKDAGAGISAPRCCDGHRQLSRPATPATVERVLAASAAVPICDAPVVLASSGSAQPSLLLRRIPPGSAPPGGSLIAQHTSLLL